MAELAGTKLLEFLYRYRPYCSAFSGYTASFRCSTAATSFHRTGFPSFAASSYSSTSLGLRFTASGVDTFKFALAADAASHSTFLRQSNAKQDRRSMHSTNKAATPNQALMMASASIMTHSLPLVSPLRGSLRLSPPRRPAPPVVLSVPGLPFRSGRHNMTDASGEAERRKAALRPRRSTRSRGPIYSRACLP